MRKESVSKEWLKQNKQTMKQHHFDTEFIDLVRRQKGSVWEAERLHLSFQFRFIAINVTLNNSQHTPHIEGQTHLLLAYEILDQQ